MAAVSQYSDGVISGMQMLYGEGFLSPGGADEVAQLLSGFDPTGLRVLDIGCGLGGFSLMLARDHGASYVTGIDIEPELVARATRTVAEAGLSKNISIQQVEPGPLPFDDQIYDLVVTKDVICHVADKAAMIADIFRVLVPGGTFLCADFFDGSLEAHKSEYAITFYQNYVAGMREYGLSFHFESRAVYEQALIDAGFATENFRDHSEISTDIARSELAYLEGLASKLVRQALGISRFRNRLHATAMRLKALESGGLLHYHILAQRHP